MKRETMKWGVIFALLLAVTCVHQVGAGPLEPPGEPGDESTKMPTLWDIYYKLLELQQNQIQIKINQCLYSDQRMCDLGNGTVYDAFLGLIWVKDMSCKGKMYWDEAMDAAASLGDGQCGLSDGSVAGDWRLPTKAEWDKIYGYGCQGFEEAFTNTYSSYLNWSSDSGSWEPDKAYVGSCDHATIAVDKKNDVGVPLVNEMFVRSD